MVIPLLLVVLPNTTNQLAAMLNFEFYCYTHIALLSFLRTLLANSDQLKFDSNKCFQDFKADFAWEFFIFLVFVNL